jgi:hypothetical protein
MQDVSVDLPDILKRNGFLPRQPADPPPLSRDPTFVPPSPVEIIKVIQSFAGFKVGWCKFQPLLSSTPLRRSKWRRY